MGLQAPKGPKENGDPLDPVGANPDRQVPLVPLVLPDLPGLRALRVNVGQLARVAVNQDLLANVDPKVPPGRPARTVLPVPQVQSALKAQPVLKAQPDPRVPQASKARPVLPVRQVRKALKALQVLKVSADLRVRPENV